MTRSDNRRIVEAARTSFDAILHSPEFQRAHGDEAQLELLLGYLGIAPGGRYLDLGTGSGYAAFAIAARQPDCLVTGLDIARRAIARNAELARKRGLVNAAFEVMDGISLRVPVAAFDGVVCRYALHHLPDLPTTLGEVNAALKRGGRLVIADPVIDARDDRDFINRFQALQPDGHVRIYPGDQLIALIGAGGFELRQSAMTEISYTRPFGPDYRALLQETPAGVLAADGIAVDGTRVAARMDILNAVFVKP